jgi:PAS domain S-box-containing protein
MNGAPDETHTFTFEIGRLREELSRLHDRLNVAQSTERHLKHAERYERALRLRQQALLELSVELSRAKSFDELCRRTIEMGRSRLGFDRLGLWFLDGTRQWMVGSYGTDEQGRLRDERSEKLPLTDEASSILEHGLPAPLVFDSDLSNHRAEKVGEGRQVWVGLGDSGKVMGFLATDNLLTQKEITQDDAAFLAMYAATVGHLCARKKADEALRRNEERFREYFLLSPIGMGVGSIDRCWLEVNDQLCVMLGRSSQELVGSSWAELAHPDDALAERTVFDRAVDGRLAGYTTDMRFQRSDGQLLFTIFSVRALRDRDGQVDQFAIQVQDITDRRKARQAIERARDELERQVEERTHHLKEANLRLQQEMHERLRTQKELEESRERLRVSERLASVGTLAAGISHEINNPIGSILLAAQFAVRLLEEPQLQPDLLKTCIHDIIRDANRCSRIVRSVLQFARKDPGELQPGDLNDVVRRAVFLGESKFKEKGVVPHLDLAEDLPVIRLNDTAMEQVLLNVLLNAADALGASPSIEIRTQQNGDRLAVTVKDNGRGMTAIEREHALDPFFTTRREQGGVGLGLSVCHGIVQRHGGRIELSGIPGKGTTVKVELPLNETVDSEGGS